MHVWLNQPSIYRNNLIIWTCQDRKLAIGKVVSTFTVSSTQKMFSRRDRSQVERMDRSWTMLSKRKIVSWVIVNFKTVQSCRMKCRVDESDVAPFFTWSFEVDGFDDNWGCKKFEIFLVRTMPSFLASSKALKFFSDIFGSRKVAKIKLVKVESSSILKISPVAVYFEFWRQYIRNLWMRSVMSNWKKS